MKKLLLILALVSTMLMSAQKQTAWLTEYNVALKQSVSNDKPILVYVTDNQNLKESERLDNEFFGTEAFKTMASELILLKLDISDKKSINYRMASHYIKQKDATGLALVDKSNNTIGAPLVEITSQNILKFLTLLNDRLK